MTCSTRYIVNIVVDCKHQVRNKGGNWAIASPKIFKSILSCLVQQQVTIKFSPLRKNQVVAVLE